MSFEQAPINVLNAAGAPDFVTYASDALLEMAIQHFEAETGRSLAPSQVETYLLNTIAYMLSVHGAEIQLTLENGFVAYARQEALDRVGADRNTPRLNAVPATTVLQFEAYALANAQIIIPQGTRVSDETGQLQFLTVTPAYVEPGEINVTVKAQATEPGVYANNLAAGALVNLVDPLPEIATVTNVSPTGGGADREEDNRYRARLPLAFERIGYGLSKERYKADVLDWSARCLDVEITRPQPGYVNIYPLMDTGVPNAEEIASLQAVFDGSNTHQGDYIQVIAPSAHQFSFDLYLTVSNQDAVTPATDAVEQVLDAWALSLGGYIAPSELIRVAKATPGVVEAATSGLALVKIAPSEWRVGTIQNVQVEVVQ